MPRVLAPAAAVAAAIACVVAPASAAASVPAPGFRPAATQLLVALLRTHPARAHPTAGAPAVVVVAGRRPITGTQTVLPVLAQQTDASGRAWLQVRLPGRRLGARTPPATGWIRAEATRLTSTSWHIVVRVRARQVQLFRAGRLARTVSAIVGRASTPTPRGSFFVEENVRLAATRAGGPFALALSARSAVFQEFDGGPGQVALHGRDGVGGTLGTAVSHGCVRLADGDITWLAARIAPGVPVTVR